MPFPLHERVPKLACRISFSALSRRAATVGRGPYAGSAMMASSSSIVVRYRDKRSRSTVISCGRGGGPHRPDPSLKGQPMRWHMWIPDAHRAELTPPVVVPSQSDQPPLLPPACTQGWLHTGRPLCALHACPAFACGPRAGMHDGARASRTWLSTVSSFSGATGAAPSPNLTPSTSASRVACTTRRYGSSCSGSGVAADNWKVCRRRGNAWRRRDGMFGPAGWRAT